MNDNETLDQLANAVGIEGDYWDIWGGHHLVPAEGKRLLLTALGLAAGDGAALEASLRLQREADWKRPLPPALVVHEGEAARITLTIPSERIVWPVAVEIIEESGESSELMLHPSELPVLDRHVVDGREMTRLEFALPVLPIGYRTLRLHGQPSQSMRLIVAPWRCYLPPAFNDDGRIWGIAAQLYSLRSKSNWGIGNFSDLRDLVDVCGDLGAGIVGLNPLHALSLENPDAASPYSPSSRLFLNPLYIDVEAVPGFAECKEAKAILNRAKSQRSACEQQAYVDYPTIKSLKLPVLEALFRAYRQRAAGDGADAAAEFERFRSGQGKNLRQFAIFETLSENFSGTPWHTWPEPYRHPDSPDVAAFAASHGERVLFYEYLQWQADRQLAAAQNRARERGLPVGIYRDLAVGAAPDGADAWIDQAVMVNDVDVGCPPDPFNMLGQNWGIPPLHPLRLREEGYAPFIAMLRANMRHAGALRIDHVMGLMHLFMIPKGQPAGMGAYIKYAFEEMLAIVCLESQRSRCLVVGEDLGTVPEGFRERMAGANVLSYRVLYFERDGGRFKSPGEYPGMALACVSTHDLPTLTGFWTGADLELKQRLNQYPNEDAQRNDAGARFGDKQQLLWALHHEGVLPGGTQPENPDGTGMTPDLLAAMHAFLARSPSRILLVQIDDLMQEEEQINLPGTVDERPNWRRRLSVSVGELAGAPVVQALGSALSGRSF